MEKVQSEDKKVGSDASQNHTNNLEEDPNQDSKELLGVGTVDTVSDKNILSQSKEEQESSEQEMEKVVYEDKKVDSDDSRNQTNDMVEQPKQDSNELLEVRNRDTVLDKNILPQSIEVQESNQQRTMSQREMNMLEIQELIAKLDEKIQMRSLETQQCKQQITESKQKQQQPLVPTQAQPQLRTHTQPQVHTLPFGPTQAQTIVPIQAQTLVPTQAQTLVPTQAQPQVRTHAQPQVQQHPIRPDHGLPQHPYPLQGGIGQNWHPNHNPWVTVPQSAQAQANAPPHYPVLGYPRHFTPPNPYYWPSMPNYGMNPATYMPPVDHGVCSKRQTNLLRDLTDVFVGLDIELQMQARAPYQNAAVGHYLQYGSLQSKKELPTSSGDKKLPTPEGDAAAARQDDTKPADVKEQIIAREIFNVIKKYMDPDNNNNNNSSSSSKPLAECDSPDKQEPNTSLTAEQTKKDNKVQSHNHKNDEDEEEDEKLMGFVTKTCYEELNARVASLGTENQDLKTLITKLTSRLDAIESASIKSAASQAELSKKLDILDVAAKKISHSDAELKEKIENLNTTCFELIKVISGVEERLKALESGHVNSKLTIIGFNARLDTMERMMMPCHDNTLENNPGEVMWRRDCSCCHPCSPSCEACAQEDSCYNGLQIDPNADFNQNTDCIFEPAVSIAKMTDTDSKFVVFNEPTRRNGQNPTFEFEEEATSVVAEEQISAFEAKPISSIWGEPLPTVEEDATCANGKETTDVPTEPTSGMEYEDWINEKYNIWYNSIINNFEAKVNKPDTKGS
ncbi:uncharacterized protein LOC124360893 isoform X2 [Homalodisca vitripennis]|uniref:uncharacterized protein LOC124360893 isoform X2 n=1 Tax=Homalodisca vitripennis TaxID=197043 RepID=UPI001EEC730B|nr:uncharacterized protein LOC124360893 isoform X2 [Homalodisca vitripennis]